MNFKIVITGILSLLFLNIQNSNAQTPTAWNGAFHSCGPGGSGVPPSPVAASVRGADLGQKFNNTINQRLACCLNSSNSKMPSYDSRFVAPPNNATQPFREKYDCVDNTPVGAPANFETLWASNTGGLTNAVILSDTLGNRVTGYYTEKGVRCRFSEANGNAAQIQVGQINPDTLVYTPRNNIVISTALRTSLNGRPGFAGPPDCQANPRDCLECPILVRAAFTSKCPENPRDGKAIKTYPPSGVPTPADGPHCAVASSVTLHVQIQQVTEIFGRPSLPTLDTTTAVGKAPVTDVSRIIKARRN